MVDNKGPAEGLPKNPLFKCRVFVGNLPTDFLTKPEVVTRFEKWGPVTEVSLHRGFAFVQFKSTEDAQAAIKGEKGTDFKGSEIDCSFAKHERGSGNKTERPGGGPRGKSPPRGGGGGRFDDRDKERDRFRDLDRERDRDRFPSYDRDRPPFDRDGPLPPPRGPRDRSPLRDRFDDDRYRDPYRRDDLLRRDRFYDERRSPPRRDPRDLDPYDRERLPPLRDDPYRRDDPRDRDDPYLRDRERDVLSRDRDDPYRAPMPAIPPQIKRETATSETNSPTVIAKASMKEHELRLQCIKIEHQTKLAYMKEEHDTKMEILQKEKALNSY